MDRYPLPFLGRRQGWMLVAQICMFFSVASLGLFDPTKEVFLITAVAVLVSFFGASHDVVADAYRRDVLEDEEIGFGTSVASNAYLVGYRFLATVLGLTIADKFGWRAAFFVLAGACLVGIIGTLIAPQPSRIIAGPKSVRDAVVLPFLNYLSRSGAVEMLLFILAYKIGDNFASNLQTTFYLKIGYSKTEIAFASKVVGFIGRFGSLQAISILGFAVMNEMVTKPWVDRLVLMGCVIGFETFCIGMSTTAYSAFMLKLCDRRFSATQFALLSSFMGIPRVFIPGWAGYVAEPFGWTKFFIFSALLALPGLLMVYFRADKWEASLPS
jgi:PAT family beta-lactamase induction signal transducer AmpG